MGRTTGGSVLANGEEPVGAEAEARSNLERRGVLPLDTSGAAAAESLDKTAVEIGAANVTMNEAFVDTSEGIVEGGTLISAGMKMAADKIAVAGDLASGAVGSARGMFAGGELMKGLMVGMIGGMVAEMIGPKVGEIFGTSKATGTAIGTVGADAAYGAAVGLAVPELGGPAVGALAGGALGIYQVAGKGLKSDIATAFKTSPMGIPLDIYDAAQSIFGGGSESKTQQEKREYARTLAKERGVTLTPADEHREYLKEESEVWSATVHKAFEGEGTASNKAREEIEKRIKVLAASAKVYGGTSTTRGTEAEEAAGVLQTRAAVELFKNPNTADLATEMLEKAQAINAAASKKILERNLTQATSAPEVEKALAQSGAESSISTKATVTNVAKQLEEEIDESRRDVERAKTRKARKEAEAQVVTHQEALGRFVQARPQLEDEIKKEESEAAASLAYKRATELSAPGNALAIQRAGANTEAKRTAEEREDTQKEKYATKLLAGNPVEQKKVKEEIETERVKHKQEAEAEAIGNREAQGAEELAKLPFGATAGTQAAIKLKTAAAKLKSMNSEKSTHSIKELREAATAYDEAKKGYEEARNAEAEELISFTESERSLRNVGNPMALANDLHAEATEMRATARTVAQRREATIKGLEAVNASQQAVQQEIAARGEIRESRELNPAQKIRTKLETINEQLKNATPEERLKLEAQKGNEQTAWRQALVTEKDEVIAFHKEKYEISGQVAIQEYESLLKTKGLAAATRREILSKIHAIEDELGVGNNQVYDLSPGNIKLPTAYDVRRAIGMAAIGGTLIHSEGGIQQQINEFHINVNDSSDVGKVADALDKALHSGVRSRMHAAGVRGS